MSMQVSTPSNEGIANGPLRKLQINTVWESELTWTPLKPSPHCQSSQLLPPSFPLAALTALGLRRACPSQYSLILGTTTHHRNGSCCYLCITITDAPVQDMLSQPLSKAPGFISSWKYMLITPYDTRTLFAPLS